MFDKHSSMIETLDYWVRRRKFDTTAGEIVAWGIAGAGVLAMLVVANPAFLVAAKSFILSKAATGLKVAGATAIVRAGSLVAKFLGDGPK